MGTLKGRRILVVEDEALIAEMVSNMLADAGAVVVGPAYQIERGVSLATVEPLDAAVLDMNIAGQDIAPIAEILEQKNIPVIFATGYSHIAPATQRRAKLLAKPYVEDKLIALLASLIAENSDAAQ